MGRIRLYLRTCRMIAAEEIARGGFSNAAKTAAAKRINARFPYMNPTGQKDIVSSSVDGLFKELSQTGAVPIDRLARRQFDKPDRRLRNSLVIESMPFSISRSTIGLA